MRKFNLVLIITLSVILTGLCGYVVYAVADAAKTTLNNTITFTAKGVFYTADVRVYDWETGKTIRSYSDKLDKSGTQSSNSDRNSISFGDIYPFSLNCNTIGYEIIITNYTTNSAINVVISNISSSTDYVKNQLETDSSVEIPASNGNDFFTFIIKTSANLAESFVFNNNFNISINQVNG